MGALNLVPVLGKNLLEDAPVPRGLCRHRVAPSWGVGMVAVKRFYHASPTSSTPHRPAPGHPHPSLSSLSNGSFQDRTNAISYTMYRVLGAKSSSKAGVTALRMSLGNC